MNEARLAEIEAAFEYDALGTYSPDHWGMAHELIAEIRRLNKQLDRMKGYWPVRITPLELK